MHNTRLLYGKAVPVVPSGFLSCSSGTITDGIKKVLSFRIEVIEMRISTLKDLLNNRLHADKVRESRIENP